jgi:hypothetical protein
MVESKNVVVDDAPLERLFDQDFQVAHTEHRKPLSYYRLPEIANHREEVRFAVDSLLEGDGFEPSVPQQIRSVFESTPGKNYATPAGKRGGRSSKKAPGVSISEASFEGRTGAWREGAAPPNSSTIFHGNSG